MSRNGLYLLISLLIVAVVGLGGYLIYQQQTQPSLAIKVDENGIVVNGNG
jgi:hypothetical protein